MNWLEKVVQSPIGELFEFRRIQERFTTGRKPRRPAILDESIFFKIVAEEFAEKSKI
jgi:hypothetical protein